jgi:Holliday junction resolvase RusA-like endonuclease
MTRSDKWKKRPCVMRYRAFRDRVREMGMEIKAPCKITFYLPMPPSWSKKKCAAFNGQPHMNKPDIDNLIKSVFDAVFEDDAHIWSVAAEKFWSEKPMITIEGMA